MKKYIVYYDEKYIKHRLEKFTKRGRLTKYCEFTFKKYRDHKVNINWSQENAKGYDGVIIVRDGEWIDGAYGKHYTQFINGKKFSYMLCEAHERLYRKWRYKGYWYLKGTKRRKGSAYKQLEHTFEHELGHSLSFLHEKFDSLHLFIKFKMYERWWATRQFDEKVSKPTIKKDPLYKNYGGINPPTSIILHTDLGTYEGSRDWLFNGTTSASYNYYVRKNGEIHEWVAPNLGAWHAGVVSGPTPEANDHYGSTNPNKSSIGICFEGMGENANEEQVKSIKHLVAWLKTEYHIEKVFAHKELTSYKPQAPLNLKKQL